jgi:hypothetical protein
VFFVSALEREEKNTKGELVELLARAKRCDPNARIVALLT